MRRPLALGAAAAAVALLAGCGSSSSSSSSSTAASAPASTPSTAASTASTSTSAAAGPGVTVEAKHAKLGTKLGTILAAGPKKLTVYLFEKDKGTTSSCTGACAKVWPPVTSAGMPTAAAGAVSADLGTVKRADGTEQVTYKGHPLYFYDDDKDAGDAYGQGSKAFGAGWYVLKPSGSKLDES